MSITAHAGHRSRWWIHQAPWLIAVLAFLVRLMSVLHAGSLESLLGYDEGVYFGASTAFVHGVMPYRDFVLVHPPGSTVLLAPFALLGNAIGEPAAWASARVFVMLLGALNAGLVVVIGRRFSASAGIIAGLLYALWLPIVHVERTTMLEVVILLGLAVALWALRTPQEAWWRVAIAGGALGLGASTKLWGAVALLVFLGWLFLSRAWKQAFVLVVAFVAVLALIVVPFLAIERGRMIDLVLFAQLQRGAGGTSRLARFSRMLNLDFARLPANGHVVTVLGLLGTLVVLAAIIITWRKAPIARLWIALLLAQALVLVTVPTYFNGYSSFVGTTLCLVLGTAAALIGSRLPSRWMRVSAVTALGLLLIVSGYRAVTARVEMVPSQVMLAKYTASAHCVGSDSAGVLLLADRLGTNIENGCPTIIDFDGSIYAVDAGANPGHERSQQRREQSMAYQAGIIDYFAHNDVLLIHRTRADGLSASAEAALARRPMLHHRSGLRIYGSP